MPSGVNYAMKFKFDALIFAIVGLLVLILLVNVLVPVFKPIAVQQAYNSGLPYNITSSAGAQVEITPTASVSYTQVAQMWDLGIQLFNLFAGVAILILLIVETVRLIKHDG